MVSASGWADTLTGLLEQQQGIYLQLQVYSHRQTKLIEAGEAEGLLELLAERQRLIDQLVVINREIEPFKQKWPALWASLDEPARAALKVHIDAVQAMLDQILQQDEADRAALVEHRRKIGGQLTGVNRGTTAHRAYHTMNGGKGQARFTDRHG